MKFFRNTLFFCVLFIGSVAKTQVSSCVNPLIGTQKMGHTFPGATAPFGMVQLSPDTDTLKYSYGAGYSGEIYRYCAGYQYDDSTIVGFSHTHFSGTGHSDLGDFLLMPTTGKLQLNPGTAANPDAGYRSRFSHEEEQARPGYYSVRLQDDEVEAELTATERVGFHRYTFPVATDSAHLILDMRHGIYDYPGKDVWTFIRVENDTLVTGFRQTRGWARTRYLYFAMTFSKPILHYGHQNNEKVLYKGFYRKFDETRDFPEMAGKEIVAWFDFNLKDHKPLLVKMALSPTSTAGAMLNLEAEIPDWDFDRIAKQTAQRWEEELAKISIEATETVKQNFYTSLYHAYLSPTIYMDVDGGYRGIDQVNHRAEGFDNYSTFSLWDTFRALHPLLTLLQPNRTNDMIRSMLAHQQQSVHKILPVWSHQANENWCMIGYHAVPVIVDAWRKGLRGFDKQEAFDAIAASANYNLYDDIGAYRKLGFVPDDLQSNAASKTLEYAYDDWCIAMMANDLKEADSMRVFNKRARSFVGLHDSITGFIRPKDSKGHFRKQFDPLATEGQGFIEGNAWNYSLFAPHDPQQLIDWQGGNEAFVTHLDSLFTMSLSAESIAHSEDITHDGIIGNYIHGNEPSHHVPYLYSYAYAPQKTQQRVRQIMERLYFPRPDGLPGNDDCGQMSAWYVFSALGFYPVCPGSNEYVLGSPIVDDAVIKLEGKSFTIKTINQSPENVFVKEIFLNGKPYHKLFIRHEEVIAGGELVFEMSDQPNESILFDDQILPYSMSRSHKTLK